MPNDYTEERWVDMAEFQGYAFSDYGRVLNVRRNSYITPQLNTRGVAIVGLMKDGLQHKRSLALLVATMFVPKTRGEAFNTPINLDGDRMNNHYRNLAWRPLWFARKYSKQFTDAHPTCETPIEDVETGEVYENSMYASMHNGVLDLDIYLSMINNTYVFPTGQIFRKVVTR